MSADKYSVPDAKELDRLDVSAMLKFHTRVATSTPLVLHVTDLSGWLFSGCQTLSVLPPDPPPLLDVSTKRMLCAAPGVPPVRPPSRASA